MSASETEETVDEEFYSDFDPFLKELIHRYYKQGGQSDKASFVALLIASGEVMSVALGAVASEKGLKRIAAGAIGVVALRVGLRFALGGPLGVLLAAGAAASLVAYLIKNRRKVSQKVGPYREYLVELRSEFEQVQSDFRDRRLNVEQRNLMLDGLAQRFLAKLG